MSTERIFLVFAVVVGSAAGPPITMRTRIIGFVIARALTVLIPMAAGIDVKMF